MAHVDQNLSHTVAFRVTEAQWRVLLSASKKAKTSVPQLAKALLFERVGIDVPKPARNSYGQKATMN